MNRSDDVIVAIESAICGGSLSLIRNGVEISNRLGSSVLSRAEDLLADIVLLLASGNIRRQEISLIAVSAGPGSFTGIRIGIATALGLKTGLGIEMASESALKAIASTETDSDDVKVALLVGRNAVCAQSFYKSDGKVKAVDEPHTVNENQFLLSARARTGAQLILHSPLFERLGSSAAIDFGNNIAFAVGKLCSQNQGEIAEPLFISKSF